jgi:SSS family solute:Na+ symporter
MTDEEKLGITADLLQNTEAPAQGTVFMFNGDFADREPAFARDIFDYNAGVSGADAAAALAEAPDVNGGIDPEDGDPWSPGEVLARANDIATESAAAKTKALVGYDYDDAFPILVALLAGPGFKGFVIAAVMGAVVSSLASMLNAASTIFTMDIFKRYLKPDATDHQQVLMGRVCVPVAVVLGCLIAPIFANPDFGGAFNAIQSLQTYLSPGILTIFLFGLFVHRAPRSAGLVGLVLSPVLAFAYAQIANAGNFADDSMMGLVFNNFLNRAALVVISISIVLAIMTMLMPLPAPIVLPENDAIELKSSPFAKLAGIGVVIATVILYIVFA